MRALNPVLALFVVASLAGSGLANETDEAVGRMHFEAGEAFYRDKRFPQALAEFTAGFELTKRPAFLLNIAQTYRQMSDLARAREFYRTFLLLDPRSMHVAEVNRLIAEIEREMQATAPPPTAPPPVEPKASPVQAPPAPVAPAAAPPPRRRVFTWVGVGLTAAALVAGGVVEGLAGSRYSDLKSSCAPPGHSGCSSSDINTLQLELNSGIGLFVAAGVLAVATVVAIILEGRATRASSRTATAALRF